MRFEALSVPDARRTGKALSDLYAVRPGCQPHRGGIMGRPLRSRGLGSKVSL